MVLRHIGCKCVCVCLSVCLRVCVCVYVSVSVWVCVCLLLTELWPGITGAGCRKRCALPCRPFSRPTGGASMLARQAEYHTRTHTHTHAHTRAHTQAHHPVCYRLYRQPQSMLWILCWKWQRETRALCRLETRARLSPLLNTPCFRVCTDRCVCSHVIVAVAVVIFVQQNGAMALARLCKDDQKLTRLRQLGGLEVLLARAK